MTDLPLMPNGVPRRCSVLHMTDAEICIRRAMHAVEGVGADTRLTDAVNYLGKAQDAVADYVDGVERRVPGV